jgi:CheY-like chemotaxis protein
MGGRGGRGSGLGLASAYGIIQNHNGIINVYSEKGKGASFTIYLPASKKTIVKDEIQPQDFIKGNETILLVDDEDMIIESAGEMLEELGYTVLTAKGGKEALQILKQNKQKIDMVILDMIMPDMSGSDTYNGLMEINPNLKVLLCSGYSVDGQATEILDRGCEGFIQKPFNLRDLSTKVRETFEKNLKLADISKTPPDLTEKRE